MPAYGSGLSAQVMFAAESTVGTPVTVTKSLEFESESISQEIGWQRSVGLRAGQGYVRSNRIQQTSYDVTGDLTFSYPDRGVGLLWKHALGTSLGPTVIAATTAYESYFTPGSKSGLGLTIQVGRPQTDAVVRPFTYRGCKIPTWEFSVSDGELCQLTLSVDGWQEATATALAVASYPATSAVFSSIHGTSTKLGGTATTTSGKTTIAGGVAATTVFKGFTVRGETPMATDRRGIGNAGVKREQIENDRPTVTGTLEGEFTSRAEIYDLAVAGTTTALQVDFDLGVAAGAGNNFFLQFILPAVKFINPNVNADGPDILGQSIDFEATDNGTDPVIQVKTVSTDTTL